MPVRTIKVDYLARVEGEGALHLRIKGDRVEEARLEIFEPPRFFEAFLRGRQWTEAPDITARICGICPVAYQMSSCHAMESIAGVRVEGALRELRRLLYCGEWIESHALHVYLLHAPDFLGYESAIHMAADHREIVQRGLRLKKVGNDLMRVVGGREIHPINVKVGGFFRAPSRAALEALAPSLEWACEAAEETVRWAAGFRFPSFAPDCELVALRHPAEYPLNEGRLVSTRGLDIEIAEFFDHFEEEHVRHSNALHCRRKDGGAYLVGPLARFVLNFDRLTPRAAAAARAAGLDPSCRNPFMTILVRGVETLYACEEALRIIAGYREPEAPAVEARPRAGTGFGCTEAPRGILLHRYRTDASGEILEARIVPPTSQNQKSMERDLQAVAQANVKLDDAKLQWLCEQAIRNYDPCISCATHFLRLEVERVGHGGVPGHRGGEPAAGG